MNLSGYSKHLPQYIKHSLMDSLIGFLVNVDALSGPVELFSWAVAFLFKSSCFQMSHVYS